MPATMSAAEAAQALDECQRSRGTHPEALARLAKGGPAAQDAVRGAVERLLRAPWRREPAAERLAAALGLGFAGEEEALLGNALLEEILNRLLEATGAADKAVRCRAVQLVALLLREAPQDGAFLADETWQSLEERLTARLVDKAPAVRAQAVAALQRLQDPELCKAGEDPVCSALERMMHGDSSAEVRKAALEAIHVTRHTLKLVVQRTRDQKDTVRACAFRQLGKRVHVRSLTIAQRVALLRDGLKDRSPSVREACESMLCEHWLKLVEGDLVALLEFLDVEAFEETARLALHTIFEKAAPSAVDLAAIVLGDPADTDEGLAASPEGALLLRARCEFLVAEGSEDQLDAVVPDLTSCCQAIQASVDKLEARQQHKKQEREGQVEGEGEGEGEGATLRLGQFIIKQLVGVAAALDSRHDLIGRKNAVALAERMLAGQLVRDADCLLAIWALLRAFYDGQDEESFVRQGVSLVLDVLEPLEISDGAQAADETEVEPWRVERAVHLAETMLASVRAPVTIPELTSLMTRIIEPNLKQAHSPELRGVAVRCLALYSQLDPNLARRHLAIFRMVLGAQDEAETTRGDALRAIFDLLMLWGVTEVTRPEEGAEVAESDDAQTAASDELVSQLLAMLDSSGKGLRLVAAEGFAKLAVVGRLVDARVLRRLLVLYFHPSSKADHRLRQCLAVCFPTLAGHTSSGRAAIESLAAPLIESVVHPVGDEDCPVAEVPSESLLLYLMHLLSFSHDRVHEDVAVALAAELLADPETPKARAVAKSLAMLGAQGDGRAGGLTLAALADDLLSEIADTTAKRQIAKWREGLPPASSPDAAAEDDEAIATRVAAARELVARRRQAVKDLEEAQERAAAAAVKARPPRKARTLAKQSKASQVASDNGDESSEAEYLSPDEQSHSSGDESVTE